MASADAHSVTISECETIISSFESSQYATDTGEADGSASYYSSFDIVKDLQKMVKNFKTKALLLEHEQESLISSLMAFRDESIMKFSKLGLRHEEVATIIDQLTNMLMDVNLKVATHRTHHEEEALHQVNVIINKLVCKFQDDGHTTKELCNVFIKCCYRPGQCTEETGVNAADEESDLETLFQAVIAKCAPDDKHRIGRRLHGLLNYIESQQRDIFFPTVVNMTI